MSCHLLCLFLLGGREQPIHATVHVHVVVVISVLLLIIYAAPDIAQTLVCLCYIGCLILDNVLKSYSCECKVAFSANGHVFF